MSVIHLRHPRHGEKIAIAEQEAQADERNGWQRFTPHAAPIEARVYDETPSFLAPKNPDDENDEPSNALTLPKRRGRPPKNPE